MFHDELLPQCSSWQVSCQIPGLYRPLTCGAGSRGSASLRAPESAHQQWGGSPHRTEHWVSVVEGNCVVEGRGGRQPKTNCQSVIKKNDEHDTARCIGEPA